MATVKVLMVRQETKRKLQDCTMPRQAWQRQMHASTNHCKHVFQLLRESSMVCCLDIWSSKTNSIYSFCFIDEFIWQCETFHEWRKP